MRRFETTAVARRLLRPRATAGCPQRDGGERARRRRGGAAKRRVPGEEPQRAPRVRRRDGVAVPVPAPVHEEQQIALQTASVRRSRLRHRAGVALAQVLQGLRRRAAQRGARGEERRAEARHEPSRGGHPRREERQLLHVRGGFVAARRVARVRVGPFRGVVATVKEASRSTDERESFRRSRATVFAAIRRLASAHRERGDQIAVRAGGSPAPIPAVAHNVHQRGGEAEKGRRRALPRSAGRRVADSRAIGARGRVELGADRRRRRVHQAAARRAQRRRRARRVERVDAEA